MLTTLRTLWQADLGEMQVLPPELTAFYGTLRLPAVGAKPRVTANFVSTLDGVTSWNVPGQMGGGEISGFSQEDAGVMGLLRATSAAVIIGAATLRVVPDHLWTAEFIQPALGTAYQVLRASLGHTQPPLAVIVTGSGDVDVALRIFTSREEPALIVTTAEGEQRLRARGLPAAVMLAAAAPAPDGKLSAASILAAVNAHLPAGPRRLLLEGGPQLMGTFFAAQAIDELFLTLSPQIAGRDGAHGAAGWRPGLVEGALLAPERPGWGRLVSVRQADSYLFLRYAMGRE